MTVRGINRNSITKFIKIESQSVNSVLLDPDPNDYHEKLVYSLFISINHTFSLNVYFIIRLFVAGNVSISENDRLNLWDTTMMPNIPGLPAIICLMFSPCVEIRYSSLLITCCNGI